MTGGNSDPEDWKPIIGTKAHKEELARKFKDNDDPMKIAIVVDMWLTGFDVPSLATMYVYTPMHGYNLMQAIARVNRVFKDKEGGLIVDYNHSWTGIQGALYTTQRSEWRSCLFPFRAWPCWYAITIALIVSFVNKPVV